MADETLITRRIDKVALFIALPIALIVAFVLIRISSVYALVAAIGLGVLIVTFVNTDFAIYMLILSMLLSPEFGSRGTSGEGVTIRIDDVLAAIILFTWLAKTALHKDLALFKKTPLNKPIALYIFICFVSTSMGMIRGNVSPLTGLFFVLKYVQYFLIYFMVSNHVTTKKQIENFYLVLLLTYIIVVIVAIAQIPQGKRLTAPFEGDGGEPNTLGGFLLLVISMNISLILTPGILKKPSQRRGLLTITMISILPFLMTNSRGSWVAGIPVIISYIVLSKRRYIIIGVLVFLIIISPLVLPEVVVSRVKYTFTEQQGYAKTLQEHLPGGIVLDTSASERVRSWKSAFRELPQHPLIGFGITGWRFLDAQYMRVLIETGAIGLAIFLYLMYSLLKLTLNIYRSAQIPFFRAFALGFFIAIVAMMTHSVGANTFIIIRIMEPFWFLCGLTMAIPHIEEIEMEKKRQQQEKGQFTKLGFI